MSPRNARLAVLVGVALPVVAGALDSERTEADLRAFLVAALQAPDGRSNGVLTGRVPALMASMFSTSAPLRVAVSTLRKYREPGCARLDVKFSQAAVIASKDAAPVEKRFAVQLNYCLDGRPPKHPDE